MASAVHTDHIEDPTAHQRSVALAGILGVFLGGFAMFYVTPFRQAFKWALGTIVLDVATLGMAIVPVHMACALAAIYHARMSVPHFAFAQTEEAFGAGYQKDGSSLQTHTPHSYYRLRSKAGA